MGLVATGQANQADQVRRSSTAGRRRRPPRSSHPRVGCRRWRRLMFKLLSPATTFPEARFVRSLEERSRRADLTAW